MTSRKTTNSLIKQEKFHILRKSKLSLAKWEDTELEWLDYYLIKFLYWTSCKKMYKSISTHWKIWSRRERRLSRPPTEISKRLRESFLAERYTRLKEYLILQEKRKSGETVLGKWDKNLNSHWGQFIQLFNISLNFKNKALEQTNNLTIL